MRDSVAAAGLGPSDVGYFSQIQNSQFQFATPNGTTPYILVFWRLGDDPRVFEMPASGDGLAIFGTIMDSWQRPVADVGASGKDRGLGGRYVLLPRGYDGDYIAGSFPVHAPTRNGFAAFRPIIPDTSPDSLSRAARFTSGIKVYPLGDPGEPSTRHIDRHGEDLDAIITWDDTLFDELSLTIDDEVVAERDLALMGQLATSGTRLDVEARAPPSTRSAPA